MSLNQKVKELTKGIEEWMVKRSLEVIDKTFKRFNKIGVAWSTGKDSTVNLFLTRQFDKNIPVLFGDSVPSYSPVIVKDQHEKLDVLPIEDMWYSIQPALSYMTMRGEEVKQVSGLKTLSRRGKTDVWAEIKNIVRHRFQGELIRICTTSGLVDVTPSHSIYRAYVGLVDAKTIKIGDKLVMPSMQWKNTGKGSGLGFFVGTKELAWLYGFFLAEGYAGISKRTSGYGRYTLEISNQDNKLLTKAKEIVEENLHQTTSIEPGNDVDVLRCSSKDVAMFFRSLFYTKDGNKRVPKCILNAPLGIKKAFLDGYSKGDGTSNERIGLDFAGFGSKSWAVVQGILELIRETSHQSFSVRRKRDKRTYVDVHINKGTKNRKNPALVKEVTRIPYEEYVYDLETAENNFFTCIGPILVHNTTQHYRETYEHRDRIAKEWNLNLINMLPNVSYEEVKGDRERCCHALKTLPALKKFKELELEAVIVGVRWSEHPVRAKERYFSKREGEQVFSHFRIHPLLHWTEEDIWKFTKAHNLPHNPLYDKGFRSIGCAPCTKPAPPDAPERSGRAQDKEKIMERLRALGYW